MSKSWKLLGSGALGVFVAAALFIGTRSAFAQSAAMNCPNNGTSTLGSCVDTTDCQNKCNAVHGMGGSVGACSGGCCRCLF